MTRPTGTLTVQTLTASLCTADELMAPKTESASRFAATCSSRRVSGPCWPLTWSRFCLRWWWKVAARLTPRLEELLLSSAGCSRVGTSTRADRKLLEVQTALTQVQCPCGGGGAGVLSQRGSGLSLESWKLHQHFQPTCPLPHRPCDLDLARRAPPTCQRWAERGGRGAALYLHSGHINPRSHPPPHSVVGPWRPLHQSV